MLKIKDDMKFNDLYITNTLEDNDKNGVYQTFSKVIRFAHHVKYGVCSASTDNLLRLES